MGFWGGSGISWTICKQSAPRFRQITTPRPHQSIFYKLYALPDAQPNGVKALKAVELSLKVGTSKFWKRQLGVADDCDKQTTMPVYHTERPPLCTAQWVWPSMSCGFACSCWKLYIFAVLQCLEALSCILRLTCYWFVGQMQRWLAAEEPLIGQFCCPVFRHCRSD